MPQVTALGAAAAGAAGVVAAATGNAHFLDFFLHDQHFGVCAAVAEALSLDLRILGRFACLPVRGDQILRYSLWTQRYAFTTSARFRDSAKLLRSEPVGQV